MGGINVLCTDKTGTLTENSLRIADLNSVDGDKSLLLRANLAAQTMGGQKSNDAFDRAISLSLDEDIVRSLSSYQFLRDMPFDPVKRRNTVLTKEGSRLIMVTKGEPGEILRLCIDGEEQFKQYQSWIVDRGRQGKRILAIASKESLEESINL